eukprot:8842780-Alexandrium_andersonii.AAC.1
MDRSRPNGTQQIPAEPDRRDVIQQNSREPCPMKRRVAERGGTWRHRGHRGNNSVRAPHMNTRV